MADIDAQHVDYAPLSTIDNSRSLYTDWTKFKLTPRRLAREWLVRRATAIFIPSGLAGGAGRPGPQARTHTTPPPGGEVRQNVVIGNAQKFEAIFKVKRRIIPCGTRTRLF